jgi:hypothetical protein
MEKKKSGTRPTGGEDEIKGIVRIDKVRREVGTHTAGRALPLDRVHG